MRSYQDENGVWHDEGHRMDSPIPMLFPPEYYSRIVEDPEPSTQSESIKTNIKSNQEVKGEKAKQKCCRCGVLSAEHSLLDKQREALKGQGVQMDDPTSLTNTSKRCYQCEECMQKLKVMDCCVCRSQPTGNTKYKYLTQEEINENPSIKTAENTTVMPGKICNRCRSKFRTAGTPKKRQKTSHDTNTTITTEIRLFVEFVLKNGTEEPIKKDFNMRPNEVTSVREMHKLLQERPKSNINWNLYNIDTIDKHEEFGWWPVGDSDESLTSYLKEPGRAKRLKVTYSKFSARR